MLSTSVPDGQYDTRDSTNVRATCYLDHGTQDANALKNSPSNKKEGWRLFCWWCQQCDWIAVLMFNGIAYVVDGIKRLCTIYRNTFRWKSQWDLTLELILWSQQINTLTIKNTTIWYCIKHYWILYYSIWIRRSSRNLELGVLNKSCPQIPRSQKTVDNGDLWHDVAVVRESHGCRNRGMIVAESCPQIPRSQKYAGFLAQSCLKIPRSQKSPWICGTK